MELQNYAQFDIFTKGRSYDSSAFRRGDRTEVWVKALPWGTDKPNTAILTIKDEASVDDEIINVVSDSSETIYRRDVLAFYDGENLLTLAVAKETIDLVGGNGIPIKIPVLPLSANLPSGAKAESYLLKPFLSIDQGGLIETTAETFTQRNRHTGLTVARAKSDVSETSSLSGAIVGSGRKASILSQIDSETYVIAIADDSGSMDDSLPEIENALDDFFPIFRDVIHGGDQAAAEEKYLGYETRTDERWLDWAADSIAQANSKGTGKIFAFLWCNESSDDTEGGSYHTGQGITVEEPSDAYLNDLDKFLTAYKDAVDVRFVLYAVELEQSNGDEFDEHVIDAYNGINGYTTALKNFGMEYRLDVPPDTSVETYVDELIRSMGRTISSGVNRSVDPGLVEAESVKDTDFRLFYQSRYAPYDDFGTGVVQNEGKALVTSFQPSAESDDFMRINIDLGFDGTTDYYRPLGTSEEDIDNFL